MGKPSCSHIQAAAARPNVLCAVDTVASFARLSSVGQSQFGFLTRMAPGVMYAPTFRMEGNTSRVTHRRKRVASSFRLLKIST